MSMSVGASTSAQVSQVALQQGTNERQEKVEHDHDGDDQTSAKQAQQAQSSSSAQSGTKGQHINTYA